MQLIYEFTRTGWHQIFAPKVTISGWNLSIIWAVAYDQITVYLRLPLSASRHNHRLYPQWNFSCIIISWWLNCDGKIYLKIVELSTGISITLSEIIALIVPPRTHHIGQCFWAPVRKSMTHYYTSENTTIRYCCYHSIYNEVIRCYSSSAFCFNFNSFLTTVADNWKNLLFRVRCLLF